MFFMLYFLLGLCSQSILVFCTNWLNLHWSWGNLTRSRQTLRAGRYGCARLTTTGPPYLLKPIKLNIEHAKLANSAKRNYVSDHNLFGSNITQNHKDVQSVFLEIPYDQCLLTTRAYQSLDSWLRWGTILHWTISFRQNCYIILNIP